MPRLLMNVTILFRTYTSALGAPLNPSCPREDLATDTARAWLLCIPSPNNQQEHLMP
jgi:hypothetical protein